MTLFGLSISPTTLFLVVSILLLAGIVKGTLGFGVGLGLGSRLRPAIPEDTFQLFVK